MFLGCSMERDLAPAPGQTPMPAEHDILIIGGGLAGLTCADALHAAGRSCQVLEASDQVGGRVRTDQVDGFLLDRGFQVLLTAYPEAQALLDYDALQLRRFNSGALVRFRERFFHFADPWRQPRHVFATALSPVATLGDKLRVARFRNHTTRGELSDIYTRSEKTTLDLLQDRGFSPAIMERFFRPFLGGVMLDRELRSSSRLCEFVFRMFSQGETALPAHGMGEIPKQIANRLPAGVVTLNCPVQSIDGEGVELASGERRAARTIVVATEAPTARRLLGDPQPADGRGVTCLYFAAEQPPVRDRTLVLNGAGTGPINNLCIPSQVASTYAPSGQSLISVTVLETHQDQDALQQQVRAQLTDWFGSVATTWRHLRSYSIPYALPVQTPPALDPVAKPSRLQKNIFHCGDHCDTASINGAMASGRRAAEAVLAAWGEQ